MDLNFEPPAEVTDLARRVSDFVKDKIVPYEKDPRWTPHGPTDELRIELNGLAREADVFAPHVPKEYGGRALGQVGRAFVFEAAGYSILGPTAIHCASPDEGNIHLLDVVARPDQRQHFLKPLAEGRIRSCCPYWLTGLPSSFWRAHSRWRSWSERVSALPKRPNCPGAMASRVRVS